MRKPITCSPDDSVIDAAKIMNSRNVGSVIVTSEKGEILGILTERDIVRRVISTDIDLKKAKVKEFMSQNIVTVSPYTNLIDALKIMKKTRIRRLPVIKNNKVIGIITEREIANAIINESNEKITREILKDLLIP